MEITFWRQSFHWIETICFNRNNVSILLYTGLSAWCELICWWIARWFKKKRKIESKSLFIVQRWTGGECQKDISNDTGEAPQTSHKVEPMLQRIINSYSGKSAAVSCYYSRTEGLFGRKKEKALPLYNLTDVIFHWSLLRNSAFDSLQPRGQSSAFGNRSRTAPQQRREGDSMTGPKDTSAGHADMWGCRHPRPLQRQGGRDHPAPWDKFKINDIDLFLIRSLFIYY